MPIKDWLRPCGDALKGARKGMFHKINPIGMRHAG